MTSHPRGRGGMVIVSSAAFVKKDLVSSDFQGHPTSAARTTFPICEPFWGHTNSDEICEVGPRKASCWLWKHFKDDGF